MATATTTAALTAGCATTSAADQAWLAERDSAPAASAAPPPQPAAKPAPGGKSVEELAIAMRDDIACDQAVRGRELDHDGQGAVDLMIACAKRGKWSNLRQFLRLYNGSKTNQAAVVLLGSVLAHRGGEFSVDLPSARDAGWQVYGLDEVLGDKPMAPETWVIFRAKTHAEEVSPAGQRSIDLAEMVRGSQDVNAYAVFRGASSVTAYNLGRVGSEDFFTASGVVLRAPLEPGAPHIAADSTLIFLGRLLGAAAKGEEDVPRVRLIAQYEPGVSGF